MVPKTQSGKITWAKFGTNGFVRSKCKKSRSFVVLEVSFHGEIINFVAGGGDFTPPPPPVLIGLRRLL